MNKELHLDGSRNQIKRLARGVPLELLNDLICDFRQSNEEIIQLLQEAAELQREGLREARRMSEQADTNTDRIVNAVEELINVLKQQAENPS